MLHHISKLGHVANANQRIILGLMSGTSLDGLDLALCKVKGAGLATEVELLVFETVDYDDAFRQQVRKVFAQRTIDQLDLVLLNVQVAEVHARLVNAFLEKNNYGHVDLLASHGQTVFHAPRNWHGMAGQPNATLQLGDGDHLAVRTGLITISDFRQKHIAAGGEGAPLALYGDYLLFTSPGEDRFLLNIGGIANFTYLPSALYPLPSTKNPSTNNPLATDTGPGNTLIDAAAQRLFGVPYDRDGLLAKNGEVIPALLDLLLEEPYFNMPFPKTTGPERFAWSWVEQAPDRLPKGHNNPYDMVATLTELTAVTAANAIRQHLRSGVPSAVYYSGGGAHNPVIRSRMEALLPELAHHPFESLGMSGDAKEAVLFAVLANEAVASTDMPETNDIPWVGMGKISFPG